MIDHPAMTQIHHALAAREASRRLAYVAAPSPR